MCIVVTDPSGNGYSDTESIHAFLMAALLAKPYPCFIQFTSTNGCDLPNERNQTSRVCTTNGWGGEACDPDDLVRIIPGSAELVASRSDGSNSKRLIASEGNAVVSVTVVGFSHQAPGGSSFADRLCDAFVADGCDNTADWIPDCSLVLVIVFFLSFVIIQFLSSPRPSPHPGP